jgi:hypothetical protein
VKAASAEPERHSTRESGMDWVGMNILARAGIGGGVMLGSPAMLEHTPLTFHRTLSCLSRRGRGQLRTLLVAAAAALAMSSTGCASLVDGDHDISVDFLVVPVNGTFFGWTEITVDENIDTVSSAKLDGVVLQVEKPANIPDLSFLQNLTGTAVTSTARTVVVQQTSFPKGVQTVELQLVYYADLHPLFENQNTIRIDWTGSTNPSFTDWPAGGIWVQGNVQVELEE